MLESCSRLYEGGATGDGELHLAARKEFLPQLLLVPLLVVLSLKTPFIFCLTFDVREVEVDGCEVFLVPQSLEEGLHVLLLVSSEVEERSAAEERSTLSTGSEW